MGFFGFVASGGGTLGVLLGGVLTDALSWHWIFLVNVPIGIVVVALSCGCCRRRTARRRRAASTSRGAGGDYRADGRDLRDRQRQRQRLDLVRDARGLAVAAALLAAFLAIESRVSAPLVPLRLFRLHNLRTANIAGVLWAAAMFAWFFMAALYLQLVLGYSPLRSASPSCPRR